MSQFNFVLAYVTDPPRSAELYARLLDAKPVESSPGWAMFVLPNGIKLGLWSRTEVQPAPTAAGGSVELGFPVADDAAVLKTRDAWVALGLAIVQEPARMDFGFTFTAADPDGHRLRVFSPAGQ